MKYFLIAGERSGDLYGGNLIRALRKQDKQAKIYCYGGDFMKNAGGQLLGHYKNAAFMGFYEIVINLSKIRARLKKCKQEICDIKPDVVILIDNPGFNLRIAKYAHLQGIKTAYYISPKLWAWNRGRIKQIKMFVDRMFVIFPFEVSFYKSLGYPVTYIGNPLIEHLGDIQTAQIKGKRKKSCENIIAFLPGSRQQEVNASISMIKSLAENRPNDLILVAAVDNLPKEIYHGLDDCQNVEVYIGRTYTILQEAEVAIVTSGTATLETALLNVPQVVCYRTSSITYWIAKQLVNVKYISLVNLIADEPIVRELVQEEYNLENINTELNHLLNNSDRRQDMIAKYANIRHALGDFKTSEVLAGHVQQMVKT